MRTFLLSVAMCAALAGCKKDNKASESTAGSGSAAKATETAGSGSAAGNAMATAGQAMEAAGSAIEAAGSAAQAAGSAAEAAAQTAEAAAKAGAAAANMAGANVPRPASVTDAQVALADKLVSVMQQMGTDITAAGKDCAKAADAVKAGAAKLEPMKDEVKKWEKVSKDDPQVKAWFEANYMSKMMGAMAPMMAVAQTCATDAGFTAAMKDMKM